MQYTDQFIGHVWPRYIKCKWPSNQIIRWQIPGRTQLIHCNISNGAWSAGIWKISYQWMTISDYLNELNLRGTEFTRRDFWTRAYLADILKKSGTLSQFFPRNLSLNSGDLILADLMRQVSYNFGRLSPPIIHINPKMVTSSSQWRHRWTAWWWTWHVFFSSFSFVVS